MKLNFFNNDRHDKAIEHAKNAILEYSQAYLELKNQRLLLTSDQNLRDMKEKAKFLAIAYYNMGVEEEFFDNYQSALGSYDKACKTFEEAFGNHDPLIAKFRKAYYDAKEKLMKGGRQNTQKNRRLVIKRNGSEPGILSKTPQQVRKAQISRPQSSNYQASASGSIKFRPFSSGFPDSHNKSPQYVFQHNQIRQRNGVFSPSSVTHSALSKGGKLLSAGHMSTGNLAERQLNKSNGSTLEEEIYYQEPRDKYVSHPALVDRTRLAKEEQIPKEIQKLQLEGVLDWENEK